MTRGLLTRLAIVAMVGLSLSACAQLQNIYDTLNGSTVSYKTALVSVAAFNTLQDTGATYLKLPTCTTKNRPICHEASATANIKSAFVTGRVARNAVLSYMQTNPCDASGSCPVMPNGIYSALQGVVETLQQMYTTYNVASATGGK